MTRRKAPAIEEKKTDTPVTDGTADPALESTAEPVLESTAEPVLESTAEPVLESTGELSGEAMDVPAVESTADPTAEPNAAELPLSDGSHTSKRRLIAVGVVALLVLATVGFAATRNAFGAPPPVATNPPFMGSTQGCEASFWAAPSNFGSWEEYLPDQPVGSIFGHAGTYASLTLADALGNQVAGEDAKRTLLREAVAGALNAANDSLAYPFTRYDQGVDGRPPLVPTTNGLLTSGTDTAIAQFTSDLSQANSLNCPLGQ